MDRWQTLEVGPLIIVIGGVLLVVCSLSYLVWWMITFRPSVRTPPGGGLFLAGTVFGGVGGLVLLAVGIAALLPRASSPALVTIGSEVLLGALLLYLTSSVAHRPVTTELPLMVVWANCATRCRHHVADGRGAGGAGGVRLMVATAVATLVGLACYLIFYRLDPIPGYWIGMVPFAVDGVVATILAVIVTLTRVP